MRLFDNTLSVLGHHFALKTVTRGKVAFVDSEVGENDGYLAGMASSIALTVSIGSLLALYVCPYQATMLSATSSLIGIGVSQ